MGKMFFIVLACCSLSFISMSQAVVFINAGSRAAWGNQQQLTINAEGSVRYHLLEVNGAAKDSSFFILSQQQLNSFLDKAEQSGFFSLDNKYDGKSADGAGIYISLNKSGRKHSVSLLNTDNPVINELITLLNTILEPHKFRINYGQFVQNKRG